MTNEQLQRIIFGEGLKILFQMDLHIHTNPLTLDESLRTEVREQQVVLDPPHYTLNQLLDRLFSQSGAGDGLKPRLRVASRICREIFLQRAIQKVEGRRPTPGIVEEIATTLQELADAGLGPEDIRLIADRNSLLLPMELREKLVNLSTILQNNQRLMARAGLTDPPGRDRTVFQYLAGLFGQGKIPPLLERVERIYLHDVYYLTLLQFGIISILMRMAPSGGVVINFTNSENVDATRFIDTTWQRFVNDENLAESAIPEFIDSPPKPGSLGKLREQIFTSTRDGKRPLTSDPSLQVFSATDRYQEVDEIFQRIRKLLEENVPADQIAIVTKNLPRYESLCREVAARLRVPLVLASGLPLFHFPVVKIIFKLLDLAEGNFNRDDFLSVLDSVYLRPEKWVSEDVIGTVNACGYLDEEHGALEELLRRASIKTGSDRFLRLGERVGRLKNLLKHLTGELPMRRNEGVLSRNTFSGDKTEDHTVGESVQKTAAIHNVVNSVTPSPGLVEASQASTPLPKGRGAGGGGAAEEEWPSCEFTSVALYRKTFREFVDGVQYLIVDLGFYQKMANLRDIPAHVLQRDRQALETLFASLEEAARTFEALGEDPISYSVFLEEAIQLLREVQVSVYPATTTGIRVLEPMQTFGLKIDHLFLVGLSEGDFPSPVRESPLLKDADRRQLNPLIANVLSRRFGGVLQFPTLNKALLTSLDKNREEPLQLFSIVECAQESLHISYPRHTLDGEPLLPSIYIEEINLNSENEEWSLAQKLGVSTTKRAWSEIFDPWNLLNHIAVSWRDRPENEHTRRETLILADDLFKKQGIDLEQLQRVSKVERQRKHYLMNATERAVFKSHFADLKHLSRMAEILNLETRSWNPTQFERMASCPFVHFASDFLGLKPHNSPDDDIQPSELGKIAHEVLSQFHLSPVFGDGYEGSLRMQKIFEEVAQTWERDQVSLNQGYWKIRRSELKDALEDYAVFAANNLCDEDQEFLLEREISASLPLSSRTLLLEGRPDWVQFRLQGGRIQSIQVTDFKYSADRNRFHRMARTSSVGHLSFQLPLYLYLALQTLLANGNAASDQVRLFGRYIVLRYPRQKSCEFEMPLESLCPGPNSALFAGLERQIQKIQNGSFHPSPQPGMCEGCSYGSLCRYWTSGAGDAIEAKKQPVDE